MKKTIIFSIILLLNSYVFAENFKITHGPYLCNPTEDGISIVWTTNRPAVSWVELAPDDGSHFYAKEREAHYITKAGRKLATETLHHVRLENLIPGQKYMYRVLSQEVTEWESRNNIKFGKMADTDVYRGKPLGFKMIDKDAKELTFLVLNDIHSKASFMKEICKDVNFNEIDLIFLNGDMSSYIESEEQLFKDYIDTLVTMGASRIPLVYVRGNHETRGRFSHELINYFPTKNMEYYQSFKCGNVNFLMIDCGEDKPDSDVVYLGLADYDAYREKQALWLKDVVETPEYKNASQRIVFSHMPLVGNQLDLWHGNLHLQKTILPILNNANVQLIFSGHNHRYAYHPSKQGIANFPTLINDNQSYVICKVKDNTISVQIGGTGGVVRSLKID